MIEHIKTLLVQTKQRLENYRLSEGLRSRFAVLCEELDAIEVRDFEPSHRFEFMDLRRRLHLFADIEQDNWKFIVDSAADTSGERANMILITELVGRVELMERLGSWLNTWPRGSSPMADGIRDEAREVLSKIAETLDYYLGPEARTKARDFPFVRNANLRAIIERDYRELVLKLFPSECWKSVVVLAGSILEGLLHDLLTRDANRIAAANASGRVPTRRVRKKLLKIPIDSPNREDQWLLESLIEVADDLALLPANWKQSVQAVLRGFRNYVHPLEELRQTDKITQGEAFQSVGALMRVADHIHKNHP